MIAWVCEMFSEKDSFVFISNREHLKNSSYRAVLNSVVPRFEVVEVDPHDHGPLVSVLAAKGCVEEDEPILISYCDFTVHWDYRQFLRYAAMQDGTIVAFRGYHPASFGSTFYGYLRTQEEKVLEVREKQSFTDHRHEEFAAAGIYHFASWRLFERYAREMIAADVRCGSEYQVSLLYNPMVRDERSVGVYEAKKFICWGTPQDVEEWHFWSRYFTRCSHAKMELPHPALTPRVSE